MSKADHEPAVVGPKTTLIIQKNAQEFEPLADIDSPFCYWDVEDEMDVYHYQNLLEKLKSAAAVTAVGWRYDDDTQSDRAREYRWNERAKDVLDEALDTDRLPCGHTPHIYNAPDVDGLSCKYCADDPDRELPVFEKETVRELL